MRLSTEGRIELKYALRAERRGEIMAAAAGHVEPGAHTESLRMFPEVGWRRGQPEPFGYRVHTLYLDSPRLDGYGRRLAEADIRNRVRIRTYGLAGDDGPVFLEAKRKLHERVVKHRVLAGRALAWAEGRPEAPWIDAVARLSGRPRALGDRWLAAAAAERMVPTTVTHYVREVYEQGDSRLTIDHAVRASRGGDPRFLQRPGEVPIVPTSWIVLELKFNGTMPAWMRALVRELRLASEPVSKFALGVVRTVRDDRPLELTYLTPPSILHAGDGFVPVHLPLAAVAR